MTERLNGQTNNDSQHDRTNGADKTLCNPGELDYKKARRVIKKIVRENQEWLKEMAER